MKIMAIDTTAVVASVALVDELKVIAEYTTNYKVTHSQTIMPMIESLVNMIELDLNEVDYFACSVGPGSFTGLRIGAATIKGLAHGLDKKIIPIPTLDALAYNMISANKLIVPIMDARRNQVFTCIYNKDMNKLTDYIALDINELLPMVKEMNKEAVFLGDGIINFKDIILNYSDKFSIAPITANMQRASNVAALGLINIDKAVEPNDLEIIYLKKPQAQREMEAKIENLKNE